MVCATAHAQIDCYQPGNGAFVRSVIGHPWDTFGIEAFANVNAMDSVYGEGNWSDLRYETLEINALLNDHDFIYLEGGDDNAQELATFLNNNLPAIENWVFNGGRLVINAAPNEGGNINCGFGGITLLYDNSSTLNTDGEPVDPAHPMFTDITTNNFNGNYLGHGVFEEPATIPLLQSNEAPAEVMLCELDWGAGKVLFGGLTVPWFETDDSIWGPQPDLYQLVLNMVQYGATGDQDCPPDCLGILGGTAFLDDCGNCVGEGTGLEPCILGCIDSAACNFDPEATDDDGSCIFEVDCLGQCGGEAILDECGNCYDPTIDGIESQEFFFTSAVQLFEVPQGVDTLEVEVFGAQGGLSTGCGGINDTQNDGGLGGFAEGSFEVVAGQVIYLYVGGQGSINGIPGWNGGGTGGQYGGGGGGSSDIRTQLGFLGTRLIVAGGGGGGQYGCGADYGAGGAGGGLNGEAGQAFEGGFGGGGGSQVSGGASGTAPGSSGAFGIGGSNPQEHVAGGGGGWYGGGAAFQAGGGGGSSYIGGVFNAATQPAVHEGNGLIRITYRVEQPECEPDCNGVLNGGAYIDECGECVEGDTGLDPCIPGCTDPLACNYVAEATDEDGSCAYDFDCNGVCGGLFITDDCGTCYDPAGEIPFCEEGCDGVFYDNPANVPVIDCFGVCGGGAELDECGVCDGDNTSCLDCAGEINGPNIEDACGNCYDPADFPLDSAVFEFTGGFQVFEVPENAFSVTLRAWGAQGGNSNSCVQGEVFQEDGGLGGFAEGDLSVLPGQQLYVYAGGKGAQGGAGGWNGGGSGGFNGGGGGGASDVRTSLGNLAARVIVAGGGGAGNTGCPDAGSGGAGGGLMGEAGIAFNGNTPGSGGTQVSGGAAGTVPGQPGGFGNGGGVFASNVSGGGGGWYGGGAATSAGGGGGSSYIALLTNAQTEPGVQTGNGEVRIYWREVPPCQFGCTDENASNYDPAATNDDGTCEYIGCTDETAVNFDPFALEDDGSCLFGGCTNPDAENFDPEADVDDGTCIVLGCVDPAASNYDPMATDDDGSCIYLGCTDPEAANYDAQANEEDGSCLYEGCTNPAALNYDPDADIDDGSCIIEGCTNPEAENFNPQANLDDGSCIVFGCTNPEALNYNPLATDDDGSCEVEGCTAEFASNYNPEATIDDGSCTCDILGCTDPAALNYLPQATADDGSCIAEIPGCTDSNAPNYDAEANTDDGSCEQPVWGCTDAEAFNYNPLATQDHGGCIPLQPGCFDTNALNYSPYANTEDNSLCIYETPGDVFCGEETYWDEELQECVAFNDCPADLNDDNIINSADLLIFLSFYSLTCEVIAD